MTNKPEFFWSPPDGAPIVAMTNYRDLIVVATGSGVYIIRENDRILDHMEVSKINFDSRRPDFWNAPK